jgi:eukaryotic-like serine/threonine-protein kinase
MQSGVRGADAASEPRAFRGTPRFEPRAVLGSGGMGVVYRAYDAEMGGEVALKTLPVLSPEETMLLKHEFRALSGVTHPNLIELYDLVVDEDLAFFTMELLDGHDIVRHVFGPPRRHEARAAGPSGGFLERLGEAAAQLVRAVSALHAHGKLHRDIKPSNVQVTTGGRLVLLDLGLAVALDGGGVSWDARDEGDAAAGTLAYMAPEQIWGSTLSPATDWYAVGEVLYESLTGRAPFHGDAREVIPQKAQLALPRPAELTEGVPPALDALVMALLHPDAQKRPGRDQIAGVVRDLGGDLGGDVACDGAVDPSAREAPFVGREAELAALRCAFAAREAGAPVLARVEGPSGMGKTELVRRFIVELERDHGALALSGRCHPQESVPYRAFDGLIDALGLALSRAPELLASSPPPRHTDELLRIFPALAAVPALAEAAAPEPAAEPQEIRRRGFRALGELLGSITRTRPVVLWIDDLQWGDADSASLLRELLLGAGAPLLFVIGYRSEDLGRTAVLEDLARVSHALPEAASRRVILEPLGEGPARVIAASLLGRRDAEVDGLVASIAEGGEGSPFFIAEIARYAARRGGAAPPESSSGSRLAHVLWERLGRLGEGERRLLEVVSTAGGPLDRSLALRAAGLGEGGRPDAVRLGNARLLRVAARDGRAVLETYHDRIREALLARMPEESRRARHRALASAIEALPDPDPEALFRHALGAEDRALAARFSLAAAERAQATLAFERAAALYQHALDLGATGMARWRLYELRGEALASYGRGAEAASSFEAAAGALAREAGASVDHLFMLRRRAAEQLLRSGRSEEGLTRMRTLLRDVGTRLPASPRRAITAALLGRARLLAGGVRFTKRGAAEVPPATAARLDTLWAATTSLSMVHHTHADALGVEHLRLALASGDRSRVARALGYEATCCASVGGPLFQWQSRRLLGMVRALAEETRDPYDRAWSKMAEGTSAWLGARWAEAATRCLEGAALFREHGRGASWEIATTEVYAFSALALLGRMEELGARLPAALRSAEERDDLFALNNCRLGQHALLWLAQGRPERCYELARQAEATWPTEGFVMQRYQHLIATTQADLYTADAWSAWARVNEAWPSLEAAQFLRLACPRVELRHLRARAALAAAGCVEVSAIGLPPDRRWSRARLLREAAREAAAIRGDALPTAAPFAAMIRAGIANLRGEIGAAREELATAIGGFGEARMDLYRAAAKRQMYSLTRGREVSEGQDEVMPGVADFPRLCAALAPFGLRS